MENKILNARELASVKRVAQNVDANYQKVLRLNKKIEELTAEKNDLQEEIDGWEAPVIRKTGYRSTDLIEKVIVPQVNEDGTPKTDKEGRQLKATKFVLRYPETILPPVKVEGIIEAAADQVRIVPPTTEGLPGSDFDADGEKNFEPAL